MLNIQRGRKSEGKILNEGQTAILSRLYNEQNLTVDRLPYTDVFDKMVSDFNTQFPAVNATHHDLYNILIRLRKSSRLLRKTRKSGLQKRGCKASRNGKAQVAPVRQRVRLPPTPL